MNRLFAQKPFCYPKSVKPTAIGIYRSSNMSRIHIGYSYSFWNGKSWGPVKGPVFGTTWGNHNDCDDFVWSGDGYRNKLPVKEPLA